MTRLEHYYVCKVVFIEDNRLFLIVKIIEYNFFTRYLNETFSERLVYFLEIHISQK